MAAANGSAIRHEHSSAPRVLHVITADGHARLGPMFRSLVAGLADRGTLVTVLTNDRRLPPLLEKHAVDTHVADALCGWRQWRLHGYLRRAFDPPPDIVHVWGTAGLSYLSDWTLHAGASLLIHLTSQADVDRVLRRGVYANETLLALCGAYRRRLQQRWPGLADAFEVFGPGVRIPPAPQVPSPRGRTLGVIWVGRFDEHHGLDVLIEAVARVAAQRTDVQVALIGTGSAAQRVWQEIERRRVARCFSLVADPLVWDGTIAGADVCVVPAAQRELSLAPLVAMAHGRVVVASRDQHADWFVEDRTYLQFEPRSAVELAFHLQRAAIAHRHVVAVARAGARYAREHHDIEPLLARLATRYRESTGHNTPPSPGPGSEATP